MEKKVLDLSELQGYARLYATLMNDSAMEKNRMAHTMYTWYLSNIAAYNDRYNARLVPVSEEIFCLKMRTAKVQPYKTDIQTIKALTLLEWNMSDRPEHTGARKEISAFCSGYGESFYRGYGYSAQDSITSFTLCEDSLNPAYEPENEMNPGLLFRKQKTDMKLVYISAPLRGDVENNISFARAKSREVFEEGNIPICPHLMFPPIADPDNPIEDQKAMKMCLKLIERCNEMRVYGKEWTEGMWAEIHHAEHMKIPVMTDQTKVPQAIRSKRKDEQHER